LIDRVISNLGDEDVYTEVKEKVLELCDRFPLYKERLERG